MPIALEPGLTFKIVLDWDAEKSESIQPRTIVRALSGRCHARLADAYDGIGKHVTTSAIQEDLVNALKPVIAGWENMIDPTTGQAIEYSPDKLLDVFNTNELMELIIKTLKAGRMAANEKKESAQQP